MPGFKKCQGKINEIARLNSLISYLTFTYKIMKTKQKSNKKPEDFSPGFIFLVLNYSTLRVKTALLEVSGLSVASTV